MMTLSFIEISVIFNVRVLHGSVLKILSSLEGNCESDADYFFPMVKSTEINGHGLDNKKSSKLGTILSLFTWFLDNNILRGNNICSKIIDVTINLNASGALQYSWSFNHMPVNIGIGRCVGK